MISWNHRQLSDINQLCPIMLQNKNPRIIASFLFPMRPQVWGSGQQAKVPELCARSVYRVVLAQRNCLECKLVGPFHKSRDCCLSFHWRIPRHTQILFAEWMAVLTHKRSIIKTKILMLKIINMFIILQRRMYSLWKIRK